MRQHPSLNLNILQHIVQYANEALMVITAPDLNILEINRRACDMLGRPRKEIIGRPLSDIECALQDLFFWDDLSSNPPFEGQRIAESEWLTAEGKALPIEKRVSGFHEDGMSFWIIRAEDLSTRRKQAQDQIHLASQLQSSLEATAEGILSVDLSGKVINLNRRFVAMWGLSDDLIVARDELTLMQHILANLHEPEAYATVLAG